MEELNEQELFSIDGGWHPLNGTWYGEAAKAIDSFIDGFGDGFIDGFSQTENHLN